MVDGVDDRFRQHPLLHAFHAHSIDTVPVVELLLVVSLVVDHRHVHPRLVGHHQSPLSQPFIPCIQDRVEHGLIEQEITHPLGDDYVNFLDRQFDFFDQAVDYGDFICQVVLLDDISAMEVYVGLFYAVDVLCSALG